MKPTTTDTAEWIKEVKLHVAGVLGIFVQNGMQYCYESGLNALAELEDIRDARLKS